MKNSETNTEQAGKKKGGFRKKLISIFIILLILLIALNFILPNILNRISKKNVVTSASLEDAIMISELSTAEYVYNGIAEKYDEESDEVVCYIAYNATVKVGIDMEDVTFEIDEEEKTIMPILPEISINIATIDEDSLSYIPQNPDITMTEIISLCKEDAITEANESEELYETAEENLKSVIEALVLPLIEDTDYTLIWEDEVTDSSYDSTGSESTDSSTTESDSSLESSESN